MSSGKGQDPGAPEADDGALNVRISKEILDAVKRTSVERRIRGERPSSQRAIVEEALRDWLTSRGIKLNDLEQ